MRNKRRVIACLNIDVLGDNFECEASQTNIGQTAENTKRIVFIFRVGHCAFNWGGKIRRIFVGMPLLSSLPALWHFQQQVPFAVLLESLFSSWSCRNSCCPANCSWRDCYAVLCKLKNRAASRCPFSCSSCPHRSSSSPSRCVHYSVLMTLIS